MAHEAGPTVLRVPKTKLAQELPAARRVGGVDVLREPDGNAVDVLVVAIGRCAAMALEAAAIAGRAGYSVRVVDPCWVTPVPSELVALARAARLVVSIEDGVAVGGVGSRIAQALRNAGVDMPTREVGLPTEFLGHGTPAEVHAAAGLTAQDIGRRIIEWTAGVLPDNELAESDRAAPVAGE